MGSLTDYFCQHSFSSIMCYFVRVDGVDCYFGRSGCSEWKTASVSFLYVTSCSKLAAPYFPYLFPIFPWPEGDKQDAVPVLQVLLQPVLLPPSNHSSKGERICTSVTTQGQRGWKSAFLFMNLSQCWYLIGLINNPSSDTLHSLCCTPVPGALHPCLAALLGWWSFSQSSWSLIQGNKSRIRRNYALAGPLEVVKGLNTEFLC